MTLSKWISKHYGKNVKYNQTTSGYQCVDLAKSYCVEVLDFYKKYPELKNSWAWGDARAWYEAFSSHKPLTENFSRIANTSTFVPIEGDICVFTEGNAYGHICVACNNKSTTSKILSVDQNYPTGSKVKYCSHRYTSEGFLGVLRPFRYVKKNVNIRSNPSMSGKIKGEYSAGTKISVLELDTSGKWAKTKDGWISYKYVEEI